MIARAIRIENGVLRALAATPLFLWYFGAKVVRNLFTRRVRTFIFWEFHWDLYWAIVEGDFVGMSIRRKVEVLPPC